MRKLLLAAAGAALFACALLALLRPRDSGPGGGPPKEGPRPAGEGRTSSGAAPPGTTVPRPAGGTVETRAPSGLPPVPKEPGSVPPPPVPGKAVRPAREGRPDDRAAEWREYLGGTVDSAAERLRGARTLDAMWDTERTIYWGWGTEGVLKAIELWQQRTREAGTPNDGALWLARSEAEFLLGWKEDAAEHLVDAVLAMERDELQVREGEPRLLGFALRPNAAPLGAGEKVRVRSPGEGPDHGASGGACWGGGSVLVWEGDGEKYFEFVLGTAADDSRPAEAMAATIWAHAVALGGYGRNFPHGQPPAAVRFLGTHGLALPPEQAAPDAWARVFEDAWAFWLDRGDPAATRLRDWRERVRSFPDPGWKNRWRSGFFGGVLWSLDEEFRDRFAGVGAPRAEELRILAAHLLR